MSIDIIMKYEVWAWYWKIDQFIAKLFFLWQLQLEFAGMDQNISRLWHWIFKIDLSCQCLAVRFRFRGKVLFARKAMHIVSVGSLEYLKKTNISNSLSILKIDWKL